MNRTSSGFLSPNQKLRGRYFILHKIAEGGFGAVYKAEDTYLGNRPVAIKEMNQIGLSPHEVKEATEAFKREAFLLAGILHPHLPSIHDHFEEAGYWYLVMDFIEGETLEKYLVTLDKLPREKRVKEVLDIGIQLCTVLDYLHTRQPAIIFRDLKPTNIMRTSNGHLYLIDFGIARLFSPGRYDTAPLGTVGYAAPEQFGKNARTTPQSDIYNLGATLHELLSGDDPSNDPFNFSRLGLPSKFNSFEALITQMVNMNASQRPASMADVNDQLKQIVSQNQPTPPQPMQPPNPPPQRAFPKPLLRVLFIGLACMVAIASTGLIYTTAKINTLSANLNSIKTSLARATMQAKATATVVAANPYPSYLPGHGILALYDPLQDYSSSAKWKHNISINFSSTPNAETGECQIYQKDGYHVSSFTHGQNVGYIKVCPAEATNFSNFALEVQMTIIKGDCGAIIFRGDDSKDIEYVFKVCQDGYYALYLFKSPANTSTSLITSSFNSVINTGLNQINTLAIVANGSNIKLYVNQQQIDTITDSTFSRGQIGLAAIDYNNPTTVTFRNVKVWTF